MFYSFFNTLIKGYLKFRHGRIQSIYTEPVDLQNEVFKELIINLKQTEYGKIYGAHSILTVKDFKNKLPLVNYENIFPLIERMMAGEENVLWPGKVNWFAKSSGTTNDRSKYIPITDDNLFENHVAASWDAMSILYSNQPDAKIFDKKNLIMGGSLCHVGDKLITGDVSAILLDRMPAVGRPFYSPDFETALLSDWELKIEKMASQCGKDDIVMFAGVPTWTIVLFKRILQLTGKKNMREVWPNVKTYFHGGVGFDPYIEQFKTFFPDDDLDYYEVYNASEGYFAVQDRVNEKGMLLLLDNAVYYEFIPLENIDDTDPVTLSINEVAINMDYCIVISTSSGLWRYKPGDVVRFVTISPYRIIVTGRTKHFINVFGEEVMVSNTDRALKETCAKCGGKVNDYTVAPIYMEDDKKGGHQWLVEFDEYPESLDHFTKLLDETLRCINSDYDAKRFKDLALQNLKLDTAPLGTFSKWLKSKGKVGGQSKIPRLSNDRKYIEELQAFIQQNN
ncbi:MAG: GH3 auxin-responsive promoter family protein [Saprospiraceae bacterium]|nr:GH3 auxin-responsive promoter family protein [Saprospiraceae bacterium]